METKGRRVAIGVTALALIVLAIATWQAWPHIQFWLRFESLGPNAEGYPEYRHRETGIVFVRLPGGRFWMGAQRDDPAGQNYDPHAEPDEGPVHEVTLSSFLISKYEVTQGQWHSVMDIATRLIPPPLSPW
jgi:formylglycine-generating enzyme required for sulfatase activity